MIPHGWHDAFKSILSGQTPDVSPSAIKFALIQIWAQANEKRLDIDDDMKKIIIEEKNKLKLQLFTGS